MSGVAPRFRPADSVPIAGLGVHTGAVTWLGRPAVDAQLIEAAAAGLQPAQADHLDVVSVEPGCVATAEALRAFELASRDLPGDVVGSVVGGPDTLLDHPAFGAPARLIRLRGAGPLTPDRLAAAAPVTIPAQAVVRQLPLLDRPGGRTVHVEVGPRFVGRLEHWPGVLWANLLGLPAALPGALIGPRWLAPLRLALAALRAGSSDPDAVGRKLVRRDRGARIHPAASVEGSWLMPGAIVEAGAVVRHCILGPGAVVEAQGLAIGSVLGPGARIQRRGFATWSLLDAGAVVGGSMQLGLVGAQAQLKIGAILLDQHLDAPVRARYDGEPVDVPLGLLGAALGAGAVVGAGVAIAAGRRVDPGVKIAGSEGTIVLRDTQAPPGRYRVDAGGLRPW